MFVDWWIGLEPAQQVFWSIALVSSVLLCILTFVSLSGWDTEAEPAADATNGKRSAFTEPKTVLIALTGFGWAAVLASYFTANLQVMLLLAAVAGIIGALLPWLFGPFFSRPYFDADAALKSTGRVLTSVPPHRNGFGKVHIDLRAAPYEMDAVTAGGELPPGAPVRIVEVIDERVVLVEPLEEHGQPGNGGNPSAPGSGRLNFPG